MKIFVDNEALMDVSEFPDELNFFLRKDSKGYRINGVGIFIKKDKMFIFLPKNIDKKKITDSEVKKIAKLLLKKGNSLLDSNGDGIIFKSKFLMIINWLISDFKINGLFVTENSHYRLTNGRKINWSKTISKVDPIIYDDEIIFSGYMCKTKKISDDFLTKVHSYVLNIISEHYGNNILDFNFHYKQKEVIMSDSELIVELKNKSKKENNKRTKVLIQKLITFLKFKQKDKDILLMTSKFHVVWENMIKQVFCSDKTLFENVPKAYWNLRINNVAIKGYNSQIPDALVSNDKGKINILDGKYYDLSTMIDGGKNVPLAWYSVVKQYFYDISIGKFKDSIYGFEYEIVGNYFVFPAYKINYSRDLIIDIGTVSISLGKSKEKRINVVMIPVFSLIDLYLNFKNDDFFKKRY